jgi:hypothetical protein
MRWNVTRVPGKGIGFIFQKARRRGAGFALLSRPSQRLGASPPWANVNTAKPDIPGIHAAARRGPTTTSVLTKIAGCLPSLDVLFFTLQKLMFSVNQSQSEAEQHV